MLPIRLVLMGSPRWLEQTRVRLLVAMLLVPLEARLRRTVRRLDHRLPQLLEQMLQLQLLVRHRHPHRVPLLLHLQHPVPLVLRCYRSSRHSQPCSGRCCRCCCSQHAPSTLGVR